MYTNKTGAPICADKDGNVVPCDSPEAATVAVGAGSTLDAEAAKQFKGLPKGDDNTPAEEEQPEVEAAQPTTPESKAEAAPPEHKMETGKAIKAAEGKK